MRSGSCLVAAALVALAAHAARPAAAAERQMAVTFDDLPGPPGGLVSNDVGALRENTRLLLAAFGEARVPVVGFVNEGKLFLEGEAPADAEARIAILKLWVDAGLELDKRRAFETFLARRGYSVAPVTIDNDEYVYAAIYAEALRGSDRAMADRIGADYLRYMDEVVAFCEDVARRLSGREIRHVLLLHANSLNAEYFGRLAGAIAARGYGFVTLDEALEDEAYRLPDTYVGAWGISWLHHWETSAGRKRSPSPDPPAWVTRAYEAQKPK